MDSTKVWNRIVKHYRDNYYAKEEALQKDWEQIFSDLFNYSRFFGEIDSHRNIHIGSHQRTIPDIIIRGEHGDLFDVELKQYSMPFSVEMENQLKSYMDLLHISVGVLICQKIYLYIYDFSQSKLKRMEIPFVEDDSDGVKFVELMQRGSFSLEKVEEFIDSKTLHAQNVAAIRKEATASLVQYLLKEYFSTTYTEEEITEALTGSHWALAPIAPDPSFKPDPSPKPVPTPTPNLDPNPIVIPDNLRDILIIGKGAKGAAIEFLKPYGLALLQKSVTYAYLQEDMGLHWANPDVERLHNDWYIILNDNIGRKLTVLKIPANSLSLKTGYEIGLVVRADQPRKINLRIDPYTKIDRTSEIDFRPYVIMSIEY